MVQSLVDDAEQGGWLPKWAIVGGDEAQMNGDSADPIIADAYAMGVRNFDVAAALRFMVKGATENESGHGLQIERQYLSQYLSQHYVNAPSLDLTSIDYSIGGSATLEYAIDDFAIARMAEAEHDGHLATAMMRRASNWEYEFNPGTDSVQARANRRELPSRRRVRDGPVRARRPDRVSRRATPAQYTWSVPQDLGALASLMGGDAAASSKLGALLHVAQRKPLRSPTTGPATNRANGHRGSSTGSAHPRRHSGSCAPSSTTSTPTRRSDEPGNDDLGAISSWYVWGALGLFPVTPGSADMALASPLFPSVTIALPDGRHLVEHAPGAAASRPYVHALDGVGRAPADTGSVGGLVRRLEAFGWSARGVDRALAAGVGPEERARP